MKKLNFLFFNEEDEQVSDVLEIFKENEIRLHSNYSNYIIAMIDDNIVGVVAICLYKENERFSVEFSISIKSLFKRMGIGRELVNQVIIYSKQLAGEFDYDQVEVNCYVVNREAMIPLLNEFGFIESGKSRFRKVIINYGR
jgi:RimJ/RimL family protein N-acetyltransferase